MDATGEDQRLELVKQMREHEVAVAELSSLSSNRAVYQKHGIIYFRTATHKAKASEQTAELLDQTKEKMQKLNSP
uniref:Uncharacterized protein n=1 Tax=Kalanchoe fedtschenkoi TaxID=63787 RepID=A0A7N0UI52_KALFE